MLKIKFVEFEGGYLAMQILEQGDEWYKVHITYNVFSTFYPEIGENAAAIFLRGERDLKDFFVSVEEINFETVLSWLEEAAEVVYPNHTPELKPGFYLDREVLVEVRCRNSDAWATQRLLSVFEKPVNGRVCSCQTEYYTKDLQNFELVPRDWPYFRPITQKGYTLNVDEPYPGTKIVTIEEVTQ